MKQYLELLQNIVENGHAHEDRTGTGRQSIFGTQMRFNMKDGFPLVTSRKIFTKAFVHEMLWFIRGSIDNKELNDVGVNIWNLWTVNEDNVNSFMDKYKDQLEEFIPTDVLETFKNNLLSKHVGTIGRLYGYNWRNAPSEMVHKLWPLVDFNDIPSDKIKQYKEEYPKIVASLQEEDPNASIFAFEDYCRMRYRSTIDQLNDLVINLKQRPYSARHVVSAWIPSLVPFETISPHDNVILERGALAPCHIMFQCNVTPPAKGSDKKRLSLLMYQRSVDTPVGLPYNVAQYALLLHMLAQVTDMEPYEFIWTGGDTHIYLDQMDLVLEQLSREPLPLPKLWLNPEVKDLFAFTFDDIKIEEYNVHPDEAIKPLKYPVSM